MHSAGILIYTIHPNTKDIMFLLGKERIEDQWPDSGKWASFGGNSNPGETVEQTAVREFVEETMGFVLSQEAATKSISTSLKINCRNNNMQYVIKVPWDTDLPRRYNTHIKLVGKGVFKSNNGLYEKTELKWFSLTKINANKNLFRNIFLRYLGSVVKAIRSSENAEIVTKNRFMAMNQECVTKDK